MKILMDKAPPASTLTSSNSSSSRQADSDLSPDDLFSFLISATQNEQISDDELINNEGNNKQELIGDESEQQVLLPESMMQLLSVKLNMQGDSQDTAPDINKYLTSLNQLDNAQRKMLKVDSDAAKKLLENPINGKETALQNTTGSQDVKRNSELPVSELPVSELLASELPASELPASELHESTLYKNLQKTYPNAAMSKQGVDITKMEPAVESETLTTKMKADELAMKNDMTNNTDNALTNSLIAAASRSSNNKSSDVKADYPPVVSQVIDKSVDFVNLVSQYRQHNLGQSVDLNGNTQNTLLNFAERASIKTDHFLDGSIEMNEPSSVELGKMTYNVRLKIYPPDLGRISARLKLDNNRADLFFTAENERVSQILKQHLPDLKEQLNAAMIKVDTLNVHISTNNEQLGENKDKNNSRQMQEIQYQEDSVINPTLKQPTEKKENKSDSMIDAYI